MHDVILPHQLLRQRFENIQLRQPRIRSVPFLRRELRVRDIEAVELCRERQLPA